MSLLLSYTVGLLMACISFFLHYEVLTVVAKLKSVLENSRRLIVIMMLGIFIGHTVQIAIYAFVYYLLYELGMQGFSSGFSGEALDYFRFSAVSFTTLGVGPVEPTGALGVVAALEGLTGFSLITWSASFGYSIMNKIWQDS